MRQDGYTGEELNALPLIELTRGKEVIGYVDINHPAWDGDQQNFLNAIALEENQSEDFIAVRRCSSSVKLGSERTYFPFSQFGVVLSKGKATWETSIRKIENQVTRESKQRNRDLWLPIQRLYVMGNVDEPIVCPIAGIRIDGFTWGSYVGNAWVQHHYRFVNGVSVHKENADPGAITSGVDPTVPSPRSRFALQDLARTIFLSSTAHDFLHKQMRTGDISDYQTHELPWALRSESNWNEFNRFLMQWGHDHLGDYQVWFDEQKN